jgi:hypothetical protein
MSDAHHMTNGRAKSEIEATCKQSSILTPIQNTKSLYIL